MREARIRRGLVAAVVTVTGFGNACGSGVTEEPSPAAHPRICFSTDAEFDSPNGELESETFLVSESTAVDPALAPETFVECSEGMPARARLVDDGGRRLWVGVDVVEVDEGGEFPSIGDAFFAPRALEVEPGSSAQLVISRDARGPAPIGFAVLTGGVPVVALLSNHEPDGLDLGPVHVGLGEDYASESTSACAHFALASLNVTLGDSAYSVENGEDVEFPLANGSAELTNLHTVRRKPRGDVECTDETVLTSSSWILASSR